MQLNCGLCKVRSWKFGDEEALHNHANNKLIWLNLRNDFPHPYTLDEAQRWIQNITRQVTETNFAVEVNGEAVGNISLRFGEDIDRYSAEVWYWLGQPFWGQGILTAALRAFTEYAFAQFMLTRLQALPFSQNTGSIRVLEKVGFQREGVLRCSAFKDGAVLDQLIYSYTSHDWLKPPKVLY